ncbi:MAG TPA: L,D-transpeptidase family protein [Acidimicrobiales bacterium]|nr:L,D-transpeptidase family protein [Acidimicrobiales bacterium]
MGGARRMWLAVVAAAGVLFAACSGGTPSAASRTDGALVAASGGTTTTVAARSAPSTTAPPASSSTTARVTVPTTVPPGLRVGARGPEVAALEQRLNSLHYEVGAVDDVYDQNTAYAVTAFQKVTGMERTGRATDDVIAALSTATPPPALVPGGNADRVEIDIPRQVLFLYKGGSLLKVLTISSGSNQRFCSEGYCRQAVTPGGSFGIYRQGKGWEYGPLGGLYNPQYFNGGIAIHGATSVPAYPASHGCIRIPMSAAEWFPSQVYKDMAVHVVGVPGEPLAPDIAKPVTTPQTTLPPATTTTVATPPPTLPDLLGGLLKPTAG